MVKTKSALHIGQCIKEQMAIQGLTTVGLARLLGCHRTNLYKLYDKPTIDTGVLLRVSRIMNFNFFSLYEPLVSEGEV